MCTCVGVGCGFGGRWESVGGAYLHVHVPRHDTTTRAQADIKTGPWTPEEDAILTRCVVEEGMTKWSDIAKRIPGRLSKRIRERWTCQLNPQRLSKEVAPWTPEEIETLFMAKCVASVLNM